MADFVPQGSIVRTIWGNADTIMLVFAGSAAEFALNRAVDWLFFTGALPRDPVGRLFSTASFAQDIVFVDEATAQQTFDRITAIHQAVERRRGSTMPDWANRDVLYMLMDYSCRAYELLHRPLTTAEQQDNFKVFRRVGVGLGIPDLPESYADWLIDRQRHLERDLTYSNYTAALYEQYQRHLGAWRYNLLLQTQALLVPEQVRELLRLDPRPQLARTLWIYPLMQRLRLRSLVQRILMPPRYLEAVRRLDRPAAA
jgi:uncharacterized protein (DUF2236 family)